MFDKIPVHCTISGTSISDIEEAFKSYTTRDDIAIVLINQNVSLKILTLIN